MEIISSDNVNLIDDKNSICNNFIKEIDNNEKDKIKQKDKDQDIDKVSFKDKMEMMIVFKNVINNNKFNVDENLHFTKQFIKDMILSNNDLKKILFGIKDHKKLKQKNNKNILSLLKNNDTGMDFKIVLNEYLQSVKFMYNEPQFIQKLNQEIYRNLIIKIKSLAEFNSGMCKFLNGANNFLDVKEMLSLASGKGKDLKEGKDQIKNEIPNTLDIPLNDDDYYEPPDFDFKKNFRPPETIFKYLITSKYIMSEIYNSKSGNLNTNYRPFSKFNFKLKTFDFNWYFKTFYILIDNLVNTNEEKLNCKNRRNLILGFLKDNKRLDLIEELNHGFVPSLRKEIYSFLLQIDDVIFHNENVGINSDKDNLDSKIYEEEILTVFDIMIQEDIYETFDTENFFLMTEVVHQVLRKLFRDKELLINKQVSRPLLLIPCTNKSYIPFPTSGIFPIQGLSYQCAIFCYLSNKSEEVYKIFSHIYCKYLIKTHSFTSDQNSLISLIYNFDTVYTTLFPDVKAKCDSVSLDLNFEIIKYFMNLFCDILSVQDVFIIIDVILLSESVHILVLVALSLLNYKRKEILNSKNSEEVLNSIYYIKFEDIRIVEIIRDFLK